MPTTAVEPPKRLHVAVGVIVDDHGQLLIAKRAAHLHQGGLWEFPGGKVDEGETIQQALRRELDEELGIQVTAFSPLVEIHHDYPDRHVLLDVWRVDGFDGVPHGREGQPLRWVAPADLIASEFPEANRPIIDTIRATFGSS